MDSSPAPRKLPRSVEMVLALFMFAGLAVMIWVMSQARPLPYWSSVKIEARLNAAGELEVVEKHSIVITGGYSERERWFWGEVQLQVQGVEEWDPQAQKWFSLPRGRQSGPHSYEWFKDHIWWRIRDPSEPEFQGEERTYALKYKVLRVLSAAETGGYWLEHAFGIPGDDLYGGKTRGKSWIRYLEVNLSFDPIWKVSGPNPLRFGKRGVYFSEVFPVRVGIHQGVPSPVPSPVRQAPLLRQNLTPVYSRPTPLAVGVLMFLGLFWVFRLDQQFLRHEQKTGRIDFSESGKAEPHLSNVDEAWLKQKLFSVPAEYVAAVWDEKTDGTEIATLFWRLSVENKLRIEDLGPDPDRPYDYRRLRITRTSSIEQFRGTERILVQAIFPQGQDSVTSDEILKLAMPWTHEPMELIRDPLIQEAESFEGMAVGEVSTESSLKGLGVFAAAALLMVVGMIVTGTLPTQVIWRVVEAFFWGGLMMAAARNWVRPMIASGRLLRGLTASLALVPVLRAVWPWWNGGMEASQSEIFVGALLLLGMAFSNQVYELAKSQNTDTRMKRRRDFKRARDHFRAELLKEPPARPAIQDAWAPYLVALGLASQMDDWVESANRSRDGSWHGGFGAFGGVNGKLTRKTLQDFLLRYNRRRG